MERGLVKELTHMLTMEQGLTDLPEEVTHFKALLTKTEI